jgi:hypothetical protein
MTSAERPPPDKRRLCPSPKVGHAEHFRCLHTRITDCVCMSVFAIREMERADDGNHPQLSFAVYHLHEMLSDLKRHYHAAYNGEVES